MSLSLRDLSTGFGSFVSSFSSGNKIGKHGLQCAASVKSNFDSTFSEEWVLHLKKGLVSDTSPSNPFTMKTDSWFWSCTYFTFLHTVNPESVEQPTPSRSMKCCWSPMKSSAPTVHIYGFYPLLPQGVQTLGLAILNITSSARQLGVCSGSLVETSCFVVDLNLAGVVGFVGVEGMVGVRHLNTILSVRTSENLPFPNSGSAITS